MLLQSYAEGHWVAGSGTPVTLAHAITGEPVAEISSAGLDVAGMAGYARDKGGPALRAMTFHQRALKLKQLAILLQQHKEEFYALSKATGATRADSWIDIEGGIATLFSYSGKGRREMPNAKVYIDGPPETLSGDNSFVGQHVHLPLQGVAVHINAFNFPCWGMLEKLAPTLMAGVPAIVKPASQTAYLAALMFRRMIESEILPPGALQLICGSTGDLLDHLGCQDGARDDRQVRAEVHRHPAHAGTPGTGAGGDRCAPAQARARARRRSRQRRGGHGRVGHFGAT